MSSRVKIREAWWARVRGRGGGFGCVVVFFIGGDEIVWLRVRSRPGEGDS